MASSPATPPQRIIAAGVILLFCSWAASVLIALILSLLLAQLLDPLVRGLERIRVPRAAGALVAVVLALSAIAALGTGILSRVESFESDWPRYRMVLRGAVSAVETRLARIEKRVSEITPQTPGGPPVVHPRSTVREWLLSGLGPLYNFIVTASFVPLLAFFLLARKHEVIEATIGLAPPGTQDRVRKAVKDVGQMMQNFLAGSLAVAAVLAVASGLIFWGFGLDYPFLGGLASGLLNLVPYLGPVLASLPPALTGLARFQSIGPFLGIAGCLVGLHLLSINLLMPALVGRSVHLNALTATIALLFWGWMWGALGFLLAIPITATVRVVCDHVEDWKGIGRWMG